MTNNISIDNLVDIRNISVDKDLPQQERIIDYIKQIKDPYHYKCGRFTITEHHPLIGATIEDCLQGMMA